MVPKQPTEPKVGQPNQRLPLTRRGLPGGSFGAALSRIWPLHAPDLVLVEQQIGEAGAISQLAARSQIVLPSTVCQRLGRAALEDAPPA